MLNENYRKFIGRILGGSTAVKLELYDRFNYATNPYTFGVSSWNQVCNPYAPVGSDAFKNGISIIVGSGNEEPTVKDIRLSNMINTLSYVTASTIQGTSDYNKLVSVTYKNNTENKVTVKEVGLMIQETEGTSVMYRKALLGRVVLDTPVVMSPGDTYTFTYCIE